MIINILNTVAKKHPKKDAICTDSKTINYETLLQNIDTSVDYILNSGIDKGSIVGITIKNEVDHLIVTLALICQGIPHIVLASFEPPEIHDDIINRLKITHTIKENPTLDSENNNLWNNISIHKQVYDTNNQLSNYKIFLKTSGTTGRMNILPFTQEKITNQSLAYEWFNKERLMTFSTIEHNNARRHRIFCVFAGGTNVFLNKNNTIIDSIIKDNVSLISGSHIHAANLLKRKEKEKLSNIKLFLSGSLIPPYIRSKIIQTVTSNLIIGYGSTESGAISFTDINDHFDYESVGYPVKGTEIQIVDSDDNLLETEKCGEIRVRSNGIASQYYDNPKKTAENFKNGWYYTGDIGLKLPDGKLVIKNRKDDMITLNGINIFPSEIETILESHKDIMASAVIGIESSNHGTIPVAVIEVGESATRNLKEYMSFARAKLILRAPRKIVIVKKLPRNDQGKILKQELRALF